MKRLFCAVVCVLLLLPYTVFSSAESQVLFRDGDLERAVRQELLLNDAEPLTQEKLNQVETLTLYKSSYSSFEGLQRLKNLKTVNWLACARVLTREFLEPLSGIQELCLNFVESFSFSPSPDAFEGLAQLRELKLSWPDLVPFDPTCIGSAPRLESVTFSGQADAEKLAGEVKSAPTLSRLTLSGIVSEELKAEHFSKMSQITSLSLTYSHCPQSLTAQTFEGLSELEELELSGYGLTQLPEGLLDPLGKLKKFSLDHTNVKMVPNGLFHQNPLLAEARLQSSRITELPQALFAQNQNLEVISIAENRLLNWPDGTFDNLPKLKRVWAGGNALDLEALDYSGKRELFDTLNNLKHNTFLVEGVTSPGGKAGRDAFYPVLADGTDSDNIALFDDMNRTMQLIANANFDALSTLTLREIFDYRFFYDKYGMHSMSMRQMMQSTPEEAYSWCMELMNTMDLGVGSLEWEISILEFYAQYAEEEPLREAAASYLALAREKGQKGMYGSLLGYLTLYDCRFKIPDGVMKQGMTLNQSFSALLEYVFESPCEKVTVGDWLMQSVTNQSAMHRAKYPDEEVPAELLARDKQLQTCKDLGEIAAMFLSQLLTYPYEAGKVLDITLEELALYQSEAWNEIGYLVAGQMDSKTGTVPVQIQCREGARVAIRPNAGVKDAVPLPLPDEITADENGIYHLPVTGNKSAYYEIVATYDNGRTQPVEDVIPLRIYASAPFVLGDVTCDGEVDSMDALTALQMSVGIVPKLPMYIELLDCDSSGVVDSVDALMILQYSVGILKEL